MIKILIIDKFDINGKDSDGDPSAVVIAKMLSPCSGNSYNQKEIMDALVAGGLDLRATSTDGSNALMLAASGNDAKLVDELIYLKVDLNAVDKSGKTALDRIPYLGNSDGASIATKLIEAGATLNPQFPILKKAIEHGATPELMTYLLDHGADTKFLGNDGENAVEFFVRQMNVHATPPPNTYVSCRAYLQDNALLAKDFAVLKKIMAQGLSPNQVDLKGNTAMLALTGLIGTNNSCLDGLIPYLNFLLQNGADPNVLNQANQSAFHQLFGLNYVSNLQIPDREAVLSLMEFSAAHGLNVNLVAGGVSLLKAVYNVQYAEVSRMLIKAGAKDDVGAGSPAPAANVVTPTNACPPGAIERGWKAAQGGCLSPSGYVWSVRSDLDNCIMDAQHHQLTCQAQGATGALYWQNGYYSSVSTYCGYRKQGGRTDWKTPTYEDYARAFATDFFDEMKGKAWFSDLKYGYQYSEVYAKLSTGNTYWRGDEEGPYGYCVAKVKAANDE